MNICVTGLGLLGGSFALGIKSKRKDVRITGVDISIENRATAQRIGIADEPGEFESAVAKSDFVVIATPVSSVAELVRKALDRIKESAVVIDLGSTKGLICQEVAGHPRRGRYVAAHPIAGTENSGPESAFPTLLSHKMMIICDREKSDPEALRVTEEIFKDLEMKISYMASAEHDRHIAWVSHLSHISSFALGSTVLDKEKDERNIFNMAGSGFSSTVRLAKSSPDMWAPIFSQNSRNVSEALDAYIKKLQLFKKIIDENDEISSHNLMKEANEIRRILTGILKSE
ncbi:MAG TPA: prephenate dehydrogenase [Cyclobacteriaceae bacterium]|nr:prephenate dehydrogenase [Cyclobacteriaceae bacterium]